MIEAGTYADLKARLDAATDEKQLPKIPLMGLVKEIEDELVQEEIDERNNE